MTPTDNNAISFKIRWKDQQVVITRAEVEAARPDGDLLAMARDEFSRHMNFSGAHGASHWDRVHENGVALARLNGANLAVIALFAIFHDCRRESEWLNLDHGREAAKFLAERRQQIPLGDEEFELLRRACASHSERTNHDPDLTVMTCWDADRLDLGRVGFKPDPKRLCTPEARDERIIAWAYRRSRAGG
jgi:uncharacterized protein